MALSESMFLFEISLEEFQSSVECQHYFIQGQFADLFSLYLKGPGSTKEIIKKPRKNVNAKLRLRSKMKIKSNNDKVPDEYSKSKSIMFACNLYTLIIYMKKYPFHISLRSRNKPKTQIGSASIPWHLSFLTYLYSLSKNKDMPSIGVCGEHYIFDDATALKCIARVKLHIKLCHLHDRIPIQFRSLSENNVGIFNYTGYLTMPKDIQNAMGIGDFQNDVPQESINVIKKDSLTASKANKKVFNSKQHIISDEVEDRPEVVKNILELVKSDTHISINNGVVVKKSKSFSTLLKNDTNKFNGPIGEQVYIVGYCTVENDFAKSPKSGVSNSTSKTSAKDATSESDQPKRKYKFKTCASDCPEKQRVEASASGYSLDIPEDAAHLVQVTKCSDISCKTKGREPPPPEDDRILLDFTNLRKDCCDFTEKVEEVVGGVQAKFQVKGLPCECTCECTFGFKKKTTYCHVCGGYEIPGDELMRKPAHAMVPPCPVFHKLVDAKRLRAFSTSGSDSKKSMKSMKPSTPDKKRSAKSLTDKRSTESERDMRNNKKGKKKDDRFKFNYGYQAPHIGHGECTSPCTGSMNPVPKRMGWLWTADNIPGLKFRPNWKPGAIHKYVVRLLRMAKNPGEVLAKKRRKDGGKKKKNEKRPLLIVHKKNGEYCVTMETMKIYPKQRTYNQYPYEDKPVLTYTIGRTEEENRQRQKKKERAQRRLEREQRNFIQSAFRDMCHEICLKTYQQALGILPDAEDPECPCFPAEPDAEKLGMDLSCSCSEDKRSLSSETDSDEWIVEFTPPNATFDPKFKPKKITKVDNTTQYTYLDYRVKLLDRYGNPVPRYFKGPDGKTQCSDLGGFWGPDHTWLDINVDGYVAPDGRWAPNTFIGPNGETVDAEIGRFQAANGNWLVVGVDGFIDCHGRWRYYPKPRGMRKRPKADSKMKNKGSGDKKDLNVAYKPSETTWSCFGDASAVDLSEKGIVGHGNDKKLLYTTLKDMLAHGEKVKLPQPSTVPRLAPKRSRKQRGISPNVYFSERTKCRHPTPSQKGVFVDARGHKKYFRMKEFSEDGMEHKTAKEHRTEPTKYYAHEAGITFPGDLYPMIHT